MATTFNDLSDAELGRLLRRRYDKLCDAHDAGMSAQHPSERWAEDSEVLKQYREAATTGGIAGKVAGKDTPREDVPGLVRPHGADGRYVVAGLDGQPRFEHANGRVSVGNDAILARAKQTNPSGTKRMNMHIRGLDRLK